MMKKFIALGTKCLEFKVAADEAKGRQPDTLLIPSNYVMHAKYMHDLCSLLMHIPIYYNVISFYNHVL
jgi:hypothetical protein